jgi:hypothetical protein
VHTLGVPTYEWASWFFHALIESDIAHPKIPYSPTKPRKSPNINISTVNGGFQRVFQIPNIVEIKAPAYTQSASQERYCCDQAHSLTTYKGYDNEQEFHAHRLCVCFFDLALEAPQATLVETCCALMVPSARLPSWWEIGPFVGAVLFSVVSFCRRAVRRAAVHDAAIEPIGVVVVLIIDLVALMLRKNLCTICMQRYIFGYRIVAVSDRPLVCSTALVCGTI